MSCEVSGKFITLGLCKGLFEESQLFRGKMKNTFIFLAPVLCGLLFYAGLQIPSRINSPDFTAFQVFYLYKTNILKSHFQLFNANTQKYSGCLYNNLPCFSSVHSVMSDSLRPHEPQHARPPCPSPTPRVHPNPCPSSQWCHPTISSSVVPFSSCPQSFPASGAFQMCQLFASGGQGIGVSASTSVLPMNTQDWSPLGWTGWISLQSKGLSRVFSNITVQKHQSILQQSAFFIVQLSHPYMTTGKTIALTRQTDLWPC